MHNQSRRDTANVLIYTVCCCFCHVHRIITGSQSCNRLLLTCWARRWGVVTRVKKEESVQPLGAQSNSSVRLERQSLIKSSHEMQRWRLGRIYLRMCVCYKDITHQRLLIIGELMEQWVNKSNILKSILVSTGTLRLGTPFKVKWVKHSKGFRGGGTQ